MQQFFSESMAIKNALLPSMEARIRFDLPRALAAASNTHYSGDSEELARSLGDRFWGSAVGAFERVAVVRGLTDRRSAN